MDPIPAPPAESFLLRLLSTAWLPGGGRPRRLRRRLLVALLLLGAVELAVRWQAAALDRALLSAYRLPDVLVPPLGELAAALQRSRQHGELVGRRVIGLAGPSSVWGYGIRADRTLARRLSVKLAASSPPSLVLSLAMPRSRYADDRLVAGWFAGQVDLVLVPYSAFLADSLSQGSCPSHLPILEWSAQLPDPFPLPPGCPQPPRHHLNAGLDAAIVKGWHSYGARAALRHLLFPQTEDFGRAVADWIFRSQAADRRRSQPALRGRQLVARSTAPTPSAAPAEALRREVERLCQSYAAAGTQVAFYHLPSVASTDGAARQAAQLSQLEQTILQVAATQPRCFLLPLALPSPLLPADDYLDDFHPAESGIDKLAAGLAAALAGLPR